MPIEFPIGGVGVGRPVGTLEQSCCLVIVDGGVGFGLRLSDGRRGSCDRAMMHGFSAIHISGNLAFRGHGPGPAAEEIRGHGRKFIVALDLQTSLNLGYFELARVIQCRGGCQLGIKIKVAVMLFSFPVPSHDGR